MTIVKHPDYGFLCTINNKKMAVKKSIVTQRVSAFFFRFVDGIGFIVNDKIFFLSCFVKLNYDLH